MLPSAGSSQNRPPAAPTGLSRRQRRFRQRRPISLSVFFLNPVWRFLFLCVTVLSLLAGCRPQPGPELSQAAIGQVLEQMTERMVHDVTNPPLAARFFAYACLSGHEAYALLDHQQESFAGKLNGFTGLRPLPQPRPEARPTLAAVLAMLETARKMQPSGREMDAFRQHLLDSCKNTLHYTDAQLEASAAVASHAATQVLAYARADGYARISNYPRYAPTRAAGRWYPTPPGYFAAVEPYFATIRPFTLDSAAQFAPPPPVRFSTRKNSDFLKLLRQVATMPQTDDQRRKAAFWDCNPFALQETGHLMVGLKKISPGAHWMGIAEVACRRAGMPFGRALHVHTLVAVGLMDGFLSCWDEKYRSDRIRPETAIRQLLNPAWRPFLQTPPFPEYLSGHATASAASATILTHFFGENFAYADTVETRYGLPVRHYASFWQAAEEAGQSRLYGGIHFADAILHGQEQGRRVGQWVLGKVERANR